MANIQIRVSDTLRAQAQAVANSMGMDLPSAVRIFLTHMVRENGMPFRPMGDPFYRAGNQEALLRSAAQIDAGQAVSKTLDELQEMER